MCVVTRTAQRDTAWDSTAERDEKRRRPLRVCGDCGAATLPHSLTPSHSHTLTASLKHTHLGSMTLRISNTTSSRRLQEKANVHDHRICLCRGVRVRVWAGQIQTMRVETGSPVGSKVTAGVVATPLPQLQSSPQQESMAELTTTHRYAANLATNDSAIPCQVSCVPLFIEPPCHQQHSTTKSPPARPSPSHQSSAAVARSQTPSRPQSTLPGIPRRCTSPTACVSSCLVCVEVSRHACSCTCV